MARPHRLHGEDGDGALWLFAEAVAERLAFHNRRLAGNADVLIAFLAQRRLCDLGRRVEELQMVGKNDDLFRPRSCIVATAAATATRGELRVIGCDFLVGLDELLEYLF